MKTSNNKTNQATIIYTTLIREIGFGIRENLPRGTSVMDAKLIYAKNNNMNVKEVLDNCETIGII